MSDGAPAAGQGFRPILGEVPGRLLGTEPPVGGIELASIARGYRAADAVCKAAPVEVLEAAPFDPGRYFLLFTGDVASVEAALLAGRRAAGDALFDAFFLPRLDAQVLPALAGARAGGLEGGPGRPGAEEAMGLLESRSLCAGVRMTDAAVKEAEVTLLALRAAQGIGGKGHAVLAGPLHMIEAAVAAGAAALEEGGWLAGAEVIANPDPAFAARVAQG